MVWIALAIAVFGAFMALRSTVGPAWARALVAGAAGGVLGVALVAARKRSVVPLVAFAGALASTALAQQDAAVPVEREPRHKTVFANDYVQVFRVTLAPGESTGMHTHAHDDVAVRLSTATTASDVLGGPAGAPSSADAGFVSSRENGKKPLTHRVRNVGATPFDVLDVQILKRPEGPAAPPLATPAAENPQMRAYRWELAPGAASAVHTHARPYLIVAATGMDLRMTAPGGASMAHPVKAGDIHWVDAPVTHTLANEGQAPGVLVEIELK
jgi:quercetin dioxygenase-like cupin family protein